MLFSTRGRAIITWWPHPVHFSLKSAPTRRISHSLLPQGWGFFEFYNVSHFICHVCVSLFSTDKNVSYLIIYSPAASANASPTLPQMTRSAWLSLEVAVLID